MHLQRSTLLCNLSVALILLFATQADVYAEPSPVGNWVTLGDDGKTAKGEVRIEEGNGVLIGRIVRLLDGRSAADERCKKCRGDLKNAQLLNLQVIQGLKKTAALKWSGGEILDPASGEVYRAEVSLSSDGERLEVRGYLGLPMFGRTQTWIRANP